MSASPTTTMKVHAAMAKALADNGVTNLFGLIGDANLYFVDSFVHEQQGRYVAAANESGATLMAIGYATASEKVGVVSVTHGAAVSNTVTALCEAVRGQTPLVLICGDVPVEIREHLQRIPQREIVIATGAGFEQLRSPKTAVKDVAIALRRAWVERRPIVLNVPVEFQMAEVEYKPEIVRFLEPRGLAAAGEELDNAVGILAAAKRPVIVAGRGARHPEAKAALVKLAERIGAPLATTLKAKDLFRGEAFNLGVMGTLSSPVAVDVLTQADCILSFGASLHHFTGSYGSFVKGRRIVQCNPEPAEIGKTYPVDAALVGDPAAVAESLLHWLDEAEIPSSGFRDGELQARLDDYSPLEGAADRSTSTTIDIHRAILRLEEALPRERTLVTDGGRFVGEPLRFMSVPDPHAFVFTIHIGSIGLGLSYAIGASFAAPDRPVVLVTGDGGFMLGGLVEFNTAVREKVDLIVVMCNDSSYGAEHIQFRNKNMDPAISLFDWPDFGPVADALGGRGYTVRTMDDLETAIAGVARRDRPVLMDLKLDPDHMPPVPI